MIPAVVVFDLDNTLAESKCALTPEMAALLAKLFARTKVAVISGGKFGQFEKQVVGQFPLDTDFSNLYLLPTSGAALYTFTDKTWKLLYEERLSTEEVEEITNALQTGAETTGLIDFSIPSFGERIENRGAQVSLSVLGQQAPTPEKRAWDPSHVKRPALQAAIAPLLPDFSVKVGGLTTIDVTKKGIDKAYGIRKLAAYVACRPEDMLYVGDELRPDGNDEVVITTGIQTRSVAGPEETMGVIGELLVT